MDSIDNLTIDYKPGAVNSGNIPFEEALKELENIVRTLESGKVPLEEAVTLYKKALKLKQYCEDILKKAKLEIDEIMRNEDGSIKVETSTNN